MNITLIFCNFFGVRTKQPSPEPNIKKEGTARQEILTNGKLDGPSDPSQPANFSAPSPSSLDFDNFEEDHNSESLDRRYDRLLLKPHLLCLSSCIKLLLCSRFISVIFVYISLFVLP